MKDKRRTGLEKVHRIHVKPSNLLTFLKILKIQAKFNILTSVKEVKVEVTTLS